MYPRVSRAQVCGLKRTQIRGVNMIDERAGKIIPIPEPKTGKGKPQPKLGPVIAKGETYSVCDIGGPVHRPLWTAKIAGLGSKEIVLTGDPGATALCHGMMVLLAGHPFLVHGFSQDRRQVVLRCLPKKACAVTRIPPSTTGMCSWRYWPRRTGRRPAKRSRSRRCSPSWSRRPPSRRP